MSNMKTLTITNFTGQLTRQDYGDINSGLAKFDTSWGYNPFFSPGNLTWFKAPGDISTIINSGLALDAVSRLESGTVVNYVITSTGHLFRVIGEGASGSDLHTLTDNGETYTYGASIVFYGAANTLYVGHDKGVTKVVIDSSGNYVSNAAVGTWDATHFTPITTRRCLQEFNGNLYASNSDASVTFSNNIAEIIAAGTVSTYAKLSPSLPVGTYIRDLDISRDFTYLLISSSVIPSELVAPVNDTNNTASASSALYKWNGSDVGVTTGEALPGFQTTALESFSGSETMFMYDSFGAALYSGNRKVLTIRNSKSPWATATATNGNFLTWVNPEFVWNKDTQAGGIKGSLFYYGNLDDTLSVGLYRPLRWDSLIGGQIYQVPLNFFTTNRYVSVNTSATTQVDSNGTHIISFTDYSGSGGATNFKTYLFYIAPPDESPGGWTGATAGVYETQTQLFSKKVTARQVRVYCSPTVSGNGFDIDLIGIDGKKIANTNFSYTFGSQIDSATGSSSLDRINFNPGANTTSAIGLRITNTGSNNMNIPKVEIDYEEQGQ